MACIMSGKIAVVTGMLAPETWLTAGAAGAGGAYCAGKVYGGGYCGGKLTRPVGAGR